MTITRSYWIADTEAELLAHASDEVRLGDVGQSLDTGAFFVRRASSWLTAGGGGGGGASNLNGLSDVVLASPGLRDYLRHDGTNWKNSPIQDADIPGTIARVTAIAAAIATHVGQADPHPVYVLDTEKGTASGVATLDGAGKVPSSQLPAIAITSTFPVASQAAMLALAAQEGDVAIRTDFSPRRAFILGGTGNPAVLADWQALDPATTVESVDGRTGVVSLSDLYDATGAAAGVQANVTAHLNDTVDAHDASAISFVAAGGILSTNVQAALEEVDAEKLAVAEKGAASGVASLNASSRVVQLPADAQSSAALNKIPIAGVGGKLDPAWISEVLAIDGLSDVDAQAFADGDVLVRNGSSKWARLPRGAALQVLRVNAAGTGHEYATPSAGGNPPWAGLLQLAFGNGTPTFDRVLSAYGNAAHSVAGPTPTNIGTAVGRLWEFEVPYSLTVNRIRIWTVAAVASAYTLAIYNAAGTRVILIDPLTTVANGWVSASVAAVALPAGVYWLGLGAKVTGTTSGLRTPAAPVASFPGTAVLPGNLAASYGQARIAQVALVNGAWPAALPALAAPAWAGGATGSLPLVYLDNNAAA